MTYQNCETCQHWDESKDNFGVCRIRLPQFIEAVEGISRLEHVSNGCHLGSRAPTVDAKPECHTCASYKTPGYEEPCASCNMETNSNWTLPVPSGNGDKK